jgi:hypothetical protein
MPPVRVCVGNVLLLKNVISLNLTRARCRSRSCSRLWLSASSIPTSLGRFGSTSREIGFVIVWVDQCRNGVVLGCSSSLRAGI